MMNMANMQDKLVKQGWFRKPLGIVVPVFHYGTDTSSATTSVPEIGLKLDLGGKVLETNGTDDIVAALRTPTKRAFRLNKSQGIVSKTNIQEDLLKVGWYKKTDEAVVHGPRSYGKVDEGTTNLDLCLKNYHDGKLLSETSGTKSTVADDVADILNWIRRKEETVLPGKLQQGTVAKTELQEHLLVKGWYRVSDNSPTKSDIDPNAALIECSQDNIADLEGKSVAKEEQVDHSYNIAGKPTNNIDSNSDIEGISTGNNDSNSDIEGISTDNNANYSDIEGISTDDNDSNSDIDGKLTDGIDLERRPVNNTENVADLEEKSNDIKEFNVETERKITDNCCDIGDFKRKPFNNDNVVDYHKLGNRKTIPVKPKQFNYHQNRVEKWVENSNKNLLEIERKKKKLRRKKYEIKYEDKRSKKAKPHEKAINNLLQEGWTMVKQTRHQVTLVKLPEREPTTTCITESVSKNAEIEIEKQTQFVPCENGDVETNVTDLSNNTVSLHRVLPRSKKMLRRMFRCGRKEE